MRTVTIIETKADIVCLCETKLLAPSTRLLYALSPRRIDKWVCKNVVGASGGTMIGFDSSSYILVEELIRRFYLSVVLEGRRENFSKVITSVYGPNRRVLRPDF